MIAMQFGHGQSNPTHLLEVSSSDNLFTRKYVLRKKPPGKLLQSAHAVDREYKVLKALGDHTDVSIPKVFCLCTDSSVIRTDFYIMEFLEGRLFLDPALPKMKNPNHKRRWKTHLIANPGKTSFHAINLQEDQLRFGIEKSYRITMVLDDHRKVMDRFVEDMSESITPSDDADAIEESNQQSSDHNTASLPLCNIDLQAFTPIRNLTPRLPNCKIGVAVTRTWEVNTANASTWEFIVIDFEGHIEAKTSSAHQQICAECHVPTLGNTQAFTPI